MNGFFTILYIPESKKVKNRYVEGLVGKRACAAAEYRTEDLKENEFERLETYFVKKCSPDIDFGGR